MNEVVGILLAAGSSRRFGGDKLSQLLSGEESVAARACRHLHEAVGKVIAVIRPEADELAAMLAKTGASVIVCASAEEGMSASLAFGIREEIDAGGWIIALADMPWIRPETSRAVAAALPEASIAAPFYKGQRGHPVGFSNVFRDQLLSLSGDAGARHILERHAAQIHRLDCDDSGILLDIDLPADLADSRLRVYPQ